MENRFQKEDKFIIKYLDSRNILDFHVTPFHKNPTFTSHYNILLRKLSKSEWETTNSSVAAQWPKDKIAYQDRTYLSNREKNQTELISAQSQKIRDSNIKYMTE